MVRKQNQKKKDLLLPEHKRHAICLCMLSNLEPEAGVLPILSGMTQDCQISVHPTALQFVGSFFFFIPAGYMHSFSMQKATCSKPNWKK